MDTLFMFYYFSQSIALGLSKYLWIESKLNQDLKLIQNLHFC